MICIHKQRPVASFLLGLGLLAGCAEAEPQRALTPVETAQEQLRRGDALAAQISLERALGEGQSREELAALFGESAMSTGDLETARSWLGPGRFSPETRAAGFRQLGRLEMAEGNLKAAAAAFDRSYRADPDSAELWTDIARLRYRGGEQLQAIDAVAKALSFDPNYGPALLFRGQLVRDAAGLEAGAALLGRALDQHPDDLDLRVEYAAALGDAGRASEALTVLRDGDGTALASGRGLFIQAVIAARGGQYRLAGDLLDRSGLVDANVPAARLLAAIVDLSEENLAGAMLLLDRLHADQPDNRRITDLLALTLSRAGSDRELVNRFAAQAAGPTGSAYLRTLVGRSYEALGERQRAAQYLDLAASGRGGLVALPAPRAQAAAMQIRNASDLRDYLRGTVAANSTAASIGAARAFARQLPGSSDVASLLGDAEFAAGDRNAARLLYEKAGKVRQTWPLLVRQLAVAEDKETRRRLITNYARNNPMNGDASILVADSLAQDRNWAASALFLDHAMALGHARNPAVLAARSVGALRLDRADEALQYALAAHELQPMNPLAISALIAALPPDQQAARAQLQAKLDALTKS